MAITKELIGEYAGYNTATLSNEYFNILKSASLAYINAATGQSFTEDTIPSDCELCAIMVIADVLRARQRLGAEAVNISLDGINTRYVSVGAKQQIEKIINNHKAVFV